MEKGLAIEHAIPRALGGSAVTLTCKKCNNDLGRELISKLKFNLVAEDKYINKKPFDAKMTVKGKSISVDYTIGEQHELITQVRRSNPKNIQHIVEVFEKGGPPEINLKFVYGYKKEVEQMAILLICYLMLFRQFGYFYAFSRWGIETRRVITNRVYDSPLLKMSAQTEAILNHGRSGLFFCTGPKELQDFAVIQLRLKTADYEKRLVKVVPFLPDTNFDEGTHLKPGVINLTARQVNFSPEFLLDPNLKLPYDVRITFG